VFAALIGHGVLCPFHRCFGATIRRFCPNDGGFSENNHKRKRGFMFTMDVAEDLKLALLQPSFAKRYFAILQEEQAYLRRWMGWAHRAEKEEFFTEFIKNNLHEYAEGRAMTCAMLYRGELVGNISFNKIFHDLKKAEIGYWLSERYQKKGIVSRSLLRMIDLAFDELGLEKVQASVGVENLPSRGVCERLGFVQEGMITRAENIGGVIIDHVIYGFTKQKHHS
jgi:ribosomal-protein-serine acetyltransferase